MSEVYNFDIDFQEYILASFVNDEDFLVKHRDIIKPEYFDDEILCGIAQAVIAFFDKKRNLPDNTALSQEIRNHMMPGRKYGEYKDAIDNIFSKSGTNTEYYREQAIEFARKQAILVAVQQSHELIESGDYEAINDIVTKAVNTGTDYRDLVYDFFGDAGQRAVKYQEKRKALLPELRPGFRNWTA